MNLTLSELAEWCGGRVDPPESADLRVRGVSSDSRTINVGELFVAINGLRQDGHRFIKYAAAAGAPAALAERRPPDVGNLPLILVRDSLRALGDLAHGYRWRPPLFPWVAITGSNGKTTTRELLSLILGARWKVRTSKRNWNNFVGLPLSILDGPDDAEAAVMEMGTSGPGEIARLREICVPTVAIVTSIGETHLSGLGSVQGVAREKAEIFAWLPPDGLAVYPADDPQAGVLKSRIPHRQASFSISGPPADVRAEEVRILSGGSEFVVEGVQVSLPLLGRHNVGNCLAAMIAARHLGIPFSESARTLRKAKPVQGRLQTRTSPAGITVIDDSYNANPNSLLAALRIMSELPPETPEGRKVAVIGDMLELGSESRRLHREIGRAAGLLDLDAIFTVGAETSVLAEAAQVNVSVGVRHFPTIEALWLELRRFLLPGDRVLVKGSRGMLMERVTAQLLDWFP